MKSSLLFLFCVVQMHLAAPALADRILARSANCGWKEQGSGANAYVCASGKHRFVLERTTATKTVVCGKLAPDHKRYVCVENGVIREITPNTSMPNPFVK